MKIQDATRDYESWLGGKTPFDHSDIQYKHARMSDPGDPFPFFRGTYYRWAQHWPEVCADLVEAPRVLGIGDLHVENFGTWRDGEGRLCWGINDYDEADEVPCVHDLVRLAASVFLLKRLGILETKFKPACVAILEGYRASLAAGGEPFVLEERHPELRALAMSSDRDPAAFWNKLTGLLQNPAVEPPPAARAALLGDWPAEHVKPSSGCGRASAWGASGNPASSCSPNGPAAGSPGKPRRSRRRPRLGPRGGTRLRGWRRSSPAPSTPGIPSTGPEGNGSRGGWARAARASNSATSAGWET